MPLRQYGKKPNRFFLTRMRSTEIPVRWKTATGDVLRATVRSRAFLYLVGLLLATQTACSSSELHAPDQRDIVVTGSLRSGTLLMPKTALYVTDMSRPGHTLEEATDLTGHFHLRLPPGTYTLHSAPVSSCPVDNTFIIPSGSPPVRLRIVASALTFTHCPPSRTEIVSATLPGRSIPKTALSIRGFLVPSPEEKGSLFLTPQASGGPVQEVVLGKDGSFLWTPPGPGSFTVQAALPGFCPVFQSFQIQKDARFLILSVHLLGKNGKCLPAKASVYSGAFALPPMPK